MKFISFAWLCVALALMAGCVTDNPPRTIQMASFKGNQRAVEQFMHKGVGVNAAGPDQERALHYAVYGDHPKMVRYLLDHGADVNARNSAGSTPLHAAAWSGNVPIAQLLLAKGADPTIKDLAGKTPSEIAKDRNQQEMVVLLAKAKP